jgi:hypothetical protein
VTSQRRWLCQTRGVVTPAWPSLSIFGTRRAGPACTSLICTRHRSAVDSPCRWSASCTEAHGDRELYLPITIEHPRLMRLLVVRTKPAMSTWLVDSLHPPATPSPFQTTDSHPSPIQSVILPMQRTSFSSCRFSSPGAVQNRAPVDLTTHRGCFWWDTVAALTS